MTSTSWGTAGVGLDDVDAEATAEDSLDWYNEYPTWKTYNITALTQKWVDGTDDNYGVLFWATNEDDYTDKDEKWVYSSEYTGDTSKRPELYVKYTVDPLVVYEYDALSRLKKADYVSDVDLINTYDPNRGWLTNRDYTTTGSGDLFTFDNIYDAAGNITKHRFEHDEGGLDSMEYAYNNLHRLTTYKYGGSTIRSYGYDNNRLTDDGSRDFTFDQAGRVDTITSTGSTILTYDIFSNMRTYGNDSYTYDAFDQRLMKTEEGVKTHYITSGPLVLAEYGGDDDNPDAEYIYGVDGLLAKVDRSYGYLWHYIDHLGSLRYLEEHLGCGLVMRRDYYPYGQNKTAIGDTASDYQFTGKELDKHTGLYYFGARYYDPSIGRWYVMDPISNDFSPYSYCYNSPLQFVDPNGESIWPILFWIGLQIFQHNYSKKHGPPPPSGGNMNFGSGNFPQPYTSSRGVYIDKFYGDPSRESQIISAWNDYQIMQEGLSPDDPLRDYPPLLTPAAQWEYNSKILSRTGGFVWALPNTIIGFGYVGLNKLVTGKPRYVGFDEKNWVWGFENVPGPYNWITLGHVICSYGEWGNLGFNDFTYVNMN